MTVSYNFYVEVCGEGGVAPTANFDSYFSLDQNENGDCGTLYFAPSLAISHWVAGFRLVKNAPFQESDVSYDVSFIGNDGGGAEDIACATVQMKHEEDLYHSISAIPNTAAGAGPAVSHYRLTATVKQDGKDDVAYTTEFAVNMQALAGVDNMPAQALSLTTNKVELVYRADNAYTVPMPGILLGGKSLPEDSWLEVYNIDRYNNWQNWGFLLDSEDNIGRTTVLGGNSFNGVKFQIRRQAVKPVSYIIIFRASLRGHCLLNVRFPMCKVPDPIPP